MKAIDNRIIFSADFIGEMAVQLLTFSKCWRVCGVYRCCFYCQDDMGNIICIGTDQVDRGPFTINGESFNHLLETGISPDDVLHTGENCICFGDYRRLIELDRTVIWDASFRFCQSIRPSLYEDIALFKNFARQDAPAESLGRLIPDIFSGSFCEQDRSLILNQLLHDRVLAVMKRIYENLNGEDPEAITSDLVDNLSALIGTGYGLTPSGDDFCCGVILGMARMQKGREAEELAVTLSRKAEGKTTPISQAYFKALAGTRVSETQALLLSTFGSSREKDLRQVLQNTADHGSTSGWDMLAGFAFGVELFRKMDGAAQVECKAGVVC